MPGFRGSDPEEREAERGQVIVLFALSLVVLVGMLALILDGGRVYTERRMAQNAADAAATAGAASLDMSSPPGSIVASLSAVQAAACKAAAANGFGSGKVDSTCGPDGTVVQIHVPGSNDGVGKLSGVLSQFEAQGYVQVTVTSNFRPFAAGIFGYNNFATSALAVAVNIPGNGVGYTLLVLDPIDCGSFSINGGTQLLVHDGGVQVDSSASRTASSTCTSQNAATLVNNSTLITDPPYPNNVVGTGDVGASPPWTNGADFVVDPLTGVHVPNFPDGNHPSVPGQPGSENAPKLWTSNVAPFPAVLPAGVIWGGLTVMNNDDLVLGGGTYILAGGGFNVQGGKVTANGPVTFIYTNDPFCNSGNKSGCTKPNLAGNGDLPSGASGVGQASGSWGVPNVNTLTAPQVNSVDPYLSGILIYIDRDILPCTGTPGNTTLNVGGNGSFAFGKGSIIYAPCSTVKLYGNGSNYGGAVVSYQISINGGKQLELGGPRIPFQGPSKSNLVQ